MQLLKYRLKKAMIIVGRLIIENLFRKKVGPERV